MFVEWTSGISTYIFIDIMQDLSLITPYLKNSEVYWIMN